MRGVRRFLKYFLLLAIIAALSLRWQISVLKPFDPDELAHLHTAWLITHDSFPYKDFFTGYPPTFSLLLAPFFWLPPSDFLPILARQFFFLVSVAAAFLIYKVGRLALSQEFSLSAVLLFLASVFTVERGVEVRPDMLLLAVWLLVVYLLMKYSNKWRSYAVGGLAGGLAAIISQKSLFGTVFIFIVVGASLWRRSFSYSLKRLALFLISFAIPGGVLLLYLYRLSLISYLPDFLIKYPLSLTGVHPWDYPWYHLGIVQDFFKNMYFTYLYKDSPIWLWETQISWIVALGATVFWMIMGLLSKKGRPGGRQFLFILVPGLVIFAVYLLQFSVKLPQYWILLTPFVYLSLSFGLSELVRVRPRLLPFFLWPVAVGAGITLLAMWTAWNRDLVTNNNLRQRQNIRTVLTETPQSAEGYDGAGSYVFRKDCYYFGMVLPQEIPKTIYRDILEDFTSGKCDFVLWGPHSRMDNWNLGERNYVKENFSPLPSNPDVLIRNRP